MVLRKTVVDMIFGKKHKNGTLESQSGTIFESENMDCNQYTIPEFTPESEDELENRDRCITQEYQIQPNQNPFNKYNVIVIERIKIYNRNKSNDKPKYCRQINVKLLNENLKDNKNYKCNEISVVITLKTNDNVNNNGKKSIYKYGKPIYSVNVKIKNIKNAIMNNFFEEKPNMKLIIKNSKYNKIYQCNEISVMNTLETDDNVVSDGKKPNYKYVDVAINLIEMVNNMYNKKKLLMEMFTKIIGKYFKGEINDDECNDKLNTMIQLLLSDSMSNLIRLMIVLKDQIKNRNCIMYIGNTLHIIES
eukprot:528675_1